MTVRTRWKKVPNQNIQQLCVDLSLWDTIDVECSGISLTDEQERLQSDLKSVYGIVDFHFSRFQITVTKADVFGWDEIRPKVESVFAEWCGQELVAV